jgi:hypothetical protein
VDARKLVNAGTQVVAKILVAQASACARERKHNPQIEILRCAQDDNAEVAYVRLSAAIVQFRTSAQAEACATASDLLICARNAD